MNTVRFYSRFFIRFCGSIVCAIAASTVSINLCWDETVPLFIFSGILPANKFFNVRLVDAITSANYAMFRFCIVMNEC